MIKIYDLKNLSNLDKWELMRKHKEFLRASISNPDEATQIAWNLEDQFDGVLQRLAIDKDKRAQTNKGIRESPAVDDYELSFRSEVKVKK